jgi:SAM-dependent methyltransferase
MGTLRRFNLPRMKSETGTVYFFAARPDGERPHGAHASEELAALLPTVGRDDFLIIDEARLYFEGQFQSGECPPGARRWSESEALLQQLQRLEQTHERLLLPQDEGYVVLAPRHHADATAWTNILSHDASPSIPVLLGVPGVTAISVQRRLADSRFSNRYFVGFGIDVGGGQDSLKLYAELFPRIRNVFVYDQVHGDAQELANVPDQSFDFLYSSHCLEHLRDPHRALANWVRVVRPGGHLVVSVPDEDLYEQKHWPSRFNSDHKLTFTICKAHSWSPVSFNAIDLVRPLVDRVQVLSIQLIDHGYRYAFLGHSVDQTRTPLAEAAIEFVLRKMPDETS